MKNEAIGFIVEDSFYETSDTVVLYLKPAEQAVDYKPGQFLTLLVPNGEKIQRKTYSIFTDRRELPRLGIAIKIIPGGFMESKINDLRKKGTRIESMKPMGKFIYTSSPGEGRTHVLIGAGSGITPLMAISQSILSEEPGSSVILFYGNRNESTIIFKQKLEQLRAENAGRFRVENYLSDGSAQWSGKRGRITEEVLAQELQSESEQVWRTAYYYLCGPEHLTNSIAAYLEKINIPKEQIMAEQFKAGTPPAQPTDNKNSSAVSITYEGKLFQVTLKKRESILDAALREGIELPHSCRSGYCSSCKAKVVTGKVRMDGQTALGKKDISEGYCVTCIGYPEAGDLHIKFEED